MADERVAGSHDVSGLRQLGSGVEERYADGDVARLELTFASGVPQFTRNGVRIVVDRGLRIAGVDLVEPVRIGGDVLMIRWRKNLGILAGIAIIIGLLVLAMFTGWVLFREAPAAGFGLLLGLGLLLLAGSRQGRRA